MQQLTRHSIEVSRVRALALNSQQVALVVDTNDLNLFYASNGVFIFSIFNLMFQICFHTLINTLLYKERVPPGVKLICLH